MAAKEWKRPHGRKVIELVHRKAITDSLLHHPNILPFLGVYYEPLDSHPIMIHPFLERGSLQDLLDGPLLDLKNFRRILSGTSSGLAYLHSQHPPIVHGNLHPGNILLNEFGHPYLSDFGLSRINHEVTRSRTILHEGSKTRFRAPEQLASRMSGRYRTSQESDIFALSMTFLNVWTGKPPFFGIKSEKKVASGIKKGQRPPRP
ncbi:kinase-like protein, partial [Clavulina sp. PMI_390]